MAYALGPTIFPLLCIITGNGCSLGSLVALPLTLCLAAICWAIWKRRNEACFENKKLKHPAEIVIHICALLSYWAGLYGSEIQDKIVEGAKILLACAHRVLAQQPRPVIYLPAPTEDLSDEEEDA